MIDHAGTTFTRPTGTTCLTYKRSIKFPQGEGWGRDVSGTRHHITGV